MAEPSASIGTAHRGQRLRAVLALAGLGLGAALASLIGSEFVLPTIVMGVVGCSVWFWRGSSPLAASLAIFEEESDGLRSRLRDVEGAVFSSSEGIAHVSDDGCFEWVNPAYAAMLGYEPDELVGMSAMTGVHREDRAKAEGAFAAIRDSRLTAIAQVRTVTKNEHIFFTRIEVVRPLEPDAQPGFFTFIQDLTEEREIDAALGLKSSELERLNTELEQFAYVAAHDLQEPARKVISFAALLEKDFEGELPENAQRDLHFITDAARRMQSLVSDLLSLSRAGRTAMNPETISLDECVDTALDVLAIKIEETGAEIVRDPMPTLEGDRTLLTQMFQNLISNALKFCDEDHPVVHITADQSPSSLIFGVRDNGIGIEPVYASQIFQPFKRLHGRSEYEGTGIGLAICQKAADRHRGDIWVESELGKGSHFRFTLGERRREQK